MCRSRGGGGGGGDRGSEPPLKNHKNKGFLSNTGPDPLKITKQPSQQSMWGHHWPASETPFKWRFASGRNMARFYCYLDHLYPHQKKKFQSWTQIGIDRSRYGYSYLASANACADPEGGQGVWTPHEKSQK